MSLTKLKLVDNNTKFCIFGYARETESSLSITVPMLIQYLIILYYWIGEKFTTHGDGIKVDKTKKIAWYNDTFGTSYNTVYGNYVIDINDTSIIRYEWTFKIISTLDIDLHPMCIGIDSSNNKFINDDFSNFKNNHPYYGIGSNGYSYYHGLRDKYICGKPVSDSDRVEFGDVVFDNWREGDIVKMTLHIKSKRLNLWTPCHMLKFGKNIDFSDARKYNIAIAMLRGSDEPLRKIQLVKFETFQK